MQGVLALPVIAANVGWGSPQLFVSRAGTLKSWGEPQPTFAVQAMQGRGRYENTKPSR